MVHNDDDPPDVYSCCDKCEANPIKKSIISLHLFGPSFIVGYLHY